MHYFQTLQRLCQIVEQVCNAVYLRLNFSVPLCACPEPGDPCSASTLASDGHSLGLTADQASGKVRALRLIFSHLIFTLSSSPLNPSHLISHLRCSPWQRPARRSNQSARATRTGIGASSPFRTSALARPTIWSYALVPTLASWVRYHEANSFRH